jgi:phosphonate transport system substrate-binding protein
MPIRIAAASIVSPQETIRSYGLFFNYLEQKVGRPIELVQRKTYEETYELLRFGTLDMAMVCTYIYVKGHDEIGLDLLAAPQVNGKAEYRSVVIVRADSKIEKFADLAGKRFAYTDPLSTTGRLYPLTMLKARGVDPGTFFSSTTYTYSHDNSVKAVVQGIVDGASVDSLVFDQLVQKNPDLGLSLRVIERSAWMPSPPVVISKRVDPQLREAFRQALLTMHEDPEGKKILAELGIERYVLQRDEDYAPVREIARKAGVLP